MDHMRRGTLRLNALKLVVLDEVDVMLNMGFRDDIELILQGTPKERQTVFFSATIPRAIQELIQKYSREPQSVRIEQKAIHMVIGRSRGLTGSFGIVGEEARHD